MTQPDARDEALEQAWGAVWWGETPPPPLLFDTFAAGWRAALAATPQEEHGQFADEAMCTCGHTGEQHYCERLQPGGTHDDDWCNACADLTPESRIHPFTLAVGPQADASEAEARERLETWLKPVVEPAELVGLALDDFADAVRASPATPPEYPVTDGWPDGMEMIRQLLRAMGEYAGARDESPKTVWDEAIAKVSLWAAPDVATPSPTKAVPQPTHPFPWHLAWMDGDTPDIMDVNGQWVAQPDAGYWFSLADLEALVALTEGVATPRQDDALRAAVVEARVIIGFLRSCVDSRESLSLADRARILKAFDGLMPWAALDAEPGEVRVRGAQGATPEAQG